MSHSISDILRQLTESGNAGDTSAALDAFKRKIWHRSFWVAGTNKLTDNGGLQVTMNLGDPVNGTNNIMRVYVSEEQAEADFGAGGSFALTFRVILVFAESERMDACIFEGDNELLITHDQLMMLRDQTAMGGAGIPMSEQEVLEQKEAGTEFAKRARAYCTGQSDIETLHLAFLMMPGVKPMLAGTLKAGNAQQHVDALMDMSRHLLRPRWRFSMFENANRIEESISGMLEQTPPCFEKKRDTGIWNKFRNTFTSQVLGICQLEMEADPTAMALDEPQIPGWAASEGAYADVVIHKT